MDVSWVSSEFSSSSSTNPGASWCCSPQKKDVARTCPSCCPSWPPHWILRTSRSRGVLPGRTHRDQPLEGKLNGLLSSESAGTSGTSTPSPPAALASSHTVSWPSSIALTFGVLGDPHVGDLCLGSLAPVLKVLQSCCKAMTVFWLWLSKSLNECLRLLHWPLVSIIPPLSGLQVYLEWATNLFEIERI